jgi:glutamate--cysteine ligase
VPHLITANPHPPGELERHILSHQDDIEIWFRQQFHEFPAPFYTSVDQRNAGYKLARVDTNLFPAGFNNLNPASKPLCIQAIQIALERFCPDAKGILIIPENHTRNLAYLDNVATIQDYISIVGYRCALGTLRDDVESEVSIDLPRARSTTLNKIHRSKNNLISIGDFTPCAVLLNNDMSGGRPEIQENIQQSVIPPLDLGWSNRFKSDHFQIYDDVAKKFCEMIDIAPWLINPLFTNCGAIDFMKREDEDCLINNTRDLLQQIQKKYDEYGITDQPYVVIKADQGTYGMDIKVAYSEDDVKSLNRKQRNKMPPIKEGGDTSEVILQEGVPTKESWGAITGILQNRWYI